jgi:hypothetical protein
VELELQAVVAYIRLETYQAVVVHQVPYVNLEEIACVEVGVAFHFGIVSSKEAFAEGLVDLVVRSVEGGVGTLVGAVLEVDDFVLAEVEIADGAFLSVIVFVAGYGS